MKNLLDDLTGWAGIYLTDPAVTGLASFDYQTHDISRELFFFRGTIFHLFFFLTGTNFPRIKKLLVRRAPYRPYPVRRPCFAPLDNESIFLPCHSSKVTFIYTYSIDRSDLPPRSPPPNTQPTACELSLMYRVMIHLFSIDWCYLSHSTDNNVTSGGHGSI